VTEVSQSALFPGRLNLLVQLDFFPIHISTQYVIKYDHKCSLLLMIISHCQCNQWSNLDIVTQYRNNSNANLLESQKLSVRQFLTKE